MINQQIEDLKKEGMIFVAATGNSGYKDKIGYPGLS